MDSTLKTRSLQSLVGDLKRKKISLSHKLQRPENQWDRKKKSELLDSLLRKYPVNPTYSIVEENGTLAIIDGVQRLSTIRDYLDNKFAFSKDMDDIIINGSTKNLSGLKFDKLDEETQRELLDAELYIYKLFDNTEKDIREMFRRQNAGKPLTNKLMRVVYESNELSDEVYSLIDHPFISKVTTPAQHKNGTDRDLIIQTLMLLVTSEDNNFTSFRTKDIDNFVMNYADQYLDKLKDISNSLDMLDGVFKEKIKIPITSIPMILYAVYEVLEKDKDFDALVEIIKEFLESYDSNDEYKQYVQSGTGSQENVNGRFQYWKNIVENL